MGLARTIFCYALTGLPILLWYLVCKNIRDYGILIGLEILLIHILVPIIVRSTSKKFYKFNFDTYYELSLRDCETETGLVVIIYLIGISILSFFRSKHWNYVEKNMMFPRWRSNGLIIFYAILVALIALLIYPVSEHYFYVGFAYINMDLRRNYRISSVILGLITGIKWFFLFDVTVKHKNAAVFWTILWVIIYGVIDYNNWHRWYFSGIALKQTLMLLYIITLILYAMGARCKRPIAISKTRYDNRISKLC